MKINWRVQRFMAKEKRAVSVISGADGPTSVFFVKKNSKMTLRQKVERIKYKIKRTYVEKTLTTQSHNLDEVMEYIVNKYGFIELDKNSDEIKEEYNQMRASFIMQYASELLGEYTDTPQLKSESQEDVRAHLEQIQKRMEKALAIPTTKFDIDYHNFKCGDVNDNMHIIIEKRFAYIGGDASGSKKVMKKFRHIYKDIYRYYGVTKEDIMLKSARYKDVVKTLSL